MADLPSALRAGEGTNPQRPPQPRRTSSNGSRLSDLVGSRRFSAVSALDADEPPSRYAYGRRESRDVSPPEEGFTSPISTTWASSRSSSGVFTAPALPALPSLSEDEPLTSPFDTQGRQHGAPPTRGRSIINKVGTVRRGLTTRQKYDQLDDVDEESIDIDISGFMGPDIEMSQYGSASPAHGLGGGMDNVLNARVSGSHKR
jgi:hypothetical protein